MLTAADFKESAAAFARSWNSAPDAEYGNWQWHGSNKVFARALGGGFLAMTGVPQPSQTSEHEAINDQADSKIAIQSMAEDESALQSDAMMTAFDRFNYHICFSPSYGVPVLFFNAFDSEGRPCTLKAMQQHFRQFNGAHGLSNCSWTFAAPEVHPVLDQPFFMLHPCQTAQTMALLQSSEGLLKEDSTASPKTMDAYSQYLIAWLGVFGPAMGLKVPRSLWPGAHQ